MDKVQAKHRMREAGIPTPDWVAFGAGAFRELGAADAFSEIESALGLPLVVKPAGQGSALGVRFAGTAERGSRRPPRRAQLRRPGPDRAARRAASELAVSILDGEALPIVEAIPEQRRRLQLRGALRDRPNPLRLPGRRSTPPTAEAVHDVALRTWEALGCEGFARVDVMLGDGRRRPAGARGQLDPRADRHLAAADGRRGGGHRLRETSSSARSSSHSLPDLEPSSGGLGLLGAVAVGASGRCRRTWSSSRSLVGQRRRVTLYLPGFLYLCVIFGAHREPPSLPSPKLPGVTR